MPAPRPTARAARAPPSRARARSPGARSARALYACRESFGIVFRDLRVARLAERAARRYLRRQVADPALRAVLTPDYTFGCKRILLSDDYYPALTQPNVDGRGRRRGRGPAARRRRARRRRARRRRDRVRDGLPRHRLPLRPSRPRARRARASPTCGRASPGAHLGTTVAGFPNLFVLSGPNTGLGHNSVVLMIEAQIEHLVGALAVYGERAASRPSSRAPRRRRRSSTRSTR